MLAGLVAIPAYLGQSRVLLAGTIGIFAMIGVSLVVLTGWAGQVSLGQVAVVGLAGAAAGSVTTRYHWDLSLALLVGGVAGRLIMTAVGLPTLRARGLTFAVTTLALALVTSSYLLNPAFFSSWLPEGPDPAHPLSSARISVESETRYYVLILVMLGVRRCSPRAGCARTRTGRVLIGTRENERAAESYGIDARRSVVDRVRVLGLHLGCRGRAVRASATRRSTSPTSRPRPGCACSRWWSSAGSGRWRARSRARSTCRASTGSSRRSGRSSRPAPACCSC